MLAVDRLIIEGTDNFGHPRQDFADKLAATDLRTYYQIAEHYIWLARYDVRDPGSDCHWRADACYDEAVRRGNPELYNRAWQRIAGKG